MGPSVKLVSPINGSFSKKKLWVFFFSRKKDQTWGGGGSEGGLAEDQTFYGFFLRHPSLRFEVGVWWVNHQSHKQPQEANRKPAKPSPLVSSKNAHCCPAA